MIALRHTLPLVRSAQGNAVAFECVWLRVALQEAAARAGYDRWWLVDDLTVGISAYLNKCYLKSVIDLPELETKVRVALGNTGYEEIAEHFFAIPPTKEISLVQCLKSAPVVNRTTFFGQIAETIAILCENQIRHFHFYDLHACVDFLKNEAGFDCPPRSENLRRKIVAFVRERVRSQGWHQQVWCSIS